MLPPRALGLLVAALGLAVTVAWWFRLSSITHVLPHYTPMKPNAAVGITGAGLALAMLVGDRSDRATTRVRLIAGFLIALGALTAAEYATGIDLRIDRLLLPPGGDSGARDPGRMALMTALVFIAVGIGLIAAVNQRWRPVHLLAAMVFTVGYVALLGYLYGVSALYRVGPYTEMSIHTAWTACVLGVLLERCVLHHGVDALVRNRGAARRIVRTVIPLVVLIVPLLGWAVLRGQQRGWHQPAFMAAAVAATVAVLGSGLTLNAAVATLKVDERQQRLREALESLNAAVVAQDLSEVFDAAPVGMVRLGPDGACFRVNAEWRRMCGLPDQDCFGDGWLAALHPEDRSKLARDVTGRAPTEGICRLLTSTGPRSMAYAVRPLQAVNGERLSYIATFADVHEQVEAVRALHDGRARIAAAFHASSLGMALVGLDGTVLEANERLGGLIGRPVAELVDRPLSALLTEEYAETEAEVRRSLLSGQRQYGRFECRLAGCTGDFTWVLASVALVNPVPAGGQYFVIEMEDITARKLVGEQLAHAAVHDALTGLPNRMLLLDRLKQALAAADRSGATVCVLFVDVDRFKSVNDRLGHQVGDEVLRAVARRLTNAARPTDTVSRLSGDEFVVLSAGLTSPGAAIQIAERCRQAIAAPVVHESLSVSINASIGIAFARGRFGEPEALLRDADAAMYEAKARGRGQCVVFDEPMLTRLNKSVAVATGLKGAVQRGEIAVHYQPVVRLDTLSITGAEALARWLPANDPPVPPDDFIPVAEETGLIIEIGEHVLRTACLDAVRWKCGPRGLRISVNVSARQLAAGDFAANVLSVLTETGLPPSALCIELTESVLIEAVFASDSLQALREVGVHLAVDNFGTGFSSLAYLRRFPVDVLKIDRAFVVGLLTSTRNRSILAGMTALGTSIGMEVVVEGVEHADQIPALIAIGCEYAQGYAFGAAAAADAVLDPQHARR